MSITVVNKYRHTPTDDDMYIGRGSPLGNPFPISAKATREDVIKRYREWLRGKLKTSGPDYDAEVAAEVRRLTKLSAQGAHLNLVCFCAPQRCHGHILKRVIDHRVQKMRASK